ncbi:MAG: relaxase/mobilization nuclease domain-containing protein, partial [Parafilimonas sp.]
NKCFGNDKELIQQFNEVRQLNPKLSKPVAHITLSFAKGEYLGNNKLTLVSEACAKELGFENNQYIAVLHKDTQHQHVHIVVNRIGFDKRTVSDSNNYQKIANFCRKTELKYGLQQVLNPTRFLSKVERNLPRNDARKKQLGLIIRGAIHKSKDFNHFVALMQSQGYKVLKARGISFVDDKKVKIKGSEVGYSLATIQRNLNALHQLKTDREFFRQLGTKQQLKPSQNTVNNVPVNVTNDLIRNRLTQDVSKTVEELLKPEQIPEQIIPKLLGKKKEKKKKKGLHL